MNLFFGLFGWRKATKCKRLIKRVQCRVKLLKNKRESIIRHLREDVVQLLKSGEDQRAFLRVDQLSKDQNIVTAYDLLDHFCEFILINLPYIRQHKDCPNDINEAASSLLYASARCGDLPELIELRKLFGRRYGKTFSVGAVELLPGNLVNRQVIEKLSTMSISHDVKFRLMKQIAIDNGIELGPPEIDCKVELQQDEVYDLSLAIYDFDSEKKVTDVVESLSSNKIYSAAKIEKPKELDHLYEPEIILHRFSSQSYPGVSSSSRVSSASIQHKIESVTEPASENSFQLSERNIVYLDDVEEFKVQPKVREDTKDKDQRLFMFKSTFTPPRGDSEASLSDLNDRDLYTDDRMETCEKSDGKISSRNTTKKRKSTRRRLKRRYNQIHNQMSSSSTSTSFSIKDMESELYYNKELNRRPCHPKKHQKESSVKQERQVSLKTSHRKKLTSTGQRYCGRRKPEESYSEDGLPQRSKCNFNCDVEDTCCLERPCYFVTSEDRDDWDSPTLRPSASQSHKSKIRRKVYKKKQRKEIESCASSSGSHSRKTSPLTQTRAHPPYLRTSMTMPPRERPKDVVPFDQIVKFASCEFPQKSTNHSNGSSSSSCPCVHPKLPDYDELAARFTALKEDYMRSSRSEFSHGSSRS